MNEEAEGIKISEFPNASEISNSDIVTGLHSGENANFTFSRIMAWFREAVTAFFVPTSREINGYPLEGDINLTASDVDGVEERILATVETNSEKLSQHNYSVGQCLMMGHNFYKVIAPIRINDTLTEGTNVEKTTVSARIVEVEGEIPTTPGDIGATAESVVAQVEAGPTSGHSYAQGNYLIYGGALCKAVVPISTGDTIEEGTNVETVTIGGELEEIRGDIPTQPSDIGAQDEILVSGILKGDGMGGVSAATPGTDYGTYSKPSGGIPSTDMTSAVQTSLGKADTAYQKPSGGIPSTDMASAVQTSLDKADTAYQKPSGGIPASDLANGVIPAVPSPSDSAPQDLASTAAAGSSRNYSRADHAHKMPSASDVGALASEGTAAAARTLAQAHSITAASAGWYKVFELTLSSASYTKNILLLVGDSYIRPINIFNLFYQKTSSADMTFRCDNISLTTYGGAFTRFKYVHSGNTASLWWHKTNANDRLVVRVLSAVNGDGTEYDVSSCWQNTYSASEPSGAMEPWSNNNIKFENVPVNAGTNQEILRITSNRIVVNMEPIRIEFANPNYITSTLNWDSATGVFTLTGTCTAATTANVLLGWNAV